LLQPTSGLVDFEGKHVSFANILELRRRMGYVIQDGGLFPHLNAREKRGAHGQTSWRDEQAIQLRVKELCELTRFRWKG